MPDAEAWGMWGIDLGALGLSAADSPAGASAIVVPTRVPHPLTEAVRDARSQAPTRLRVVELEATSLGGVAAGELVTNGGGDSSEGSTRGQEEEEADEDGEADHDHDEGHDHGDMMEITGEPSEDGLVMEPIETELGPLAAGFPGGLVASLKLDGDVVSSCRLDAALSADGAGGSAASWPLPDPLSRVAWSTALARAIEARTGTSVPPSLAYERIAALELERALSHLLWLRRIGDLLGWGTLTTRAHAAAAPLIGAIRIVFDRIPLLHPMSSDRALNAGPELSPQARERATAALPAAEALAAPLLDDLSGSRRLASRTRGVAHVDGAELTERGVAGPNARASGVADDARTGDPLYAKLGFELRAAGGGDAEARVLQRAGEALDALRLASAALRRGEAGTDSAPAAPAAQRGASISVESPRGPVAATAHAGPGVPLELAAPGSEVALAVAGEISVGLEWSSALVAIASFDPSPWSVSK